MGLRSNPVLCTSFKLQATPVLTMVWDHGQEEGTLDPSLWLLSQVVMGWGGWVQHPVADHGGPAPTPRPDHSLTSHLSPDKGDSRSAWDGLDFSAKSWDLCTSTSGLGDLRKGGFSTGRRGFLELCQATYEY